MTSWFRSFICVSRSSKKWYNGETPAVANPHESTQIDRPALPINWRLRLLDRETHINDRNQDKLMYVQVYQLPPSINLRRLNNKNISTYCYRIKNLSQRITMLHITLPLIGSVDGLSTSPINKPSKVELDVGSVGPWKPCKAFKSRTGSTYCYRIKNLSQRITMLHITLPLIGSVDGAAATAPIWRCVDTGSA
jgi:hypothetical protein